MTKVRQMSSLLGLNYIVLGPYFDGNAEYGFQLLNRIRSMVQAFSDRPTEKQHANFAMQKGKVGNRIPTHIRFVETSFAT